MDFQSILFPDSGVNESPLQAEPPDFFHDLHLDQIVTAITANWKEYDLLPFYYSPPPNMDGVTYRQEVMEDLKDKSLAQDIKSFSGHMRTVRNLLSQSKAANCYKYALERRFLRGAEIYCNAVKQLFESLCTSPLKSQGLIAFRNYLAKYLASVAFCKLLDESRMVKADLSEIEYCLFLKNESVTVRPYNAELDYSSAVEEIFAKFRRDAPTHYGLEIPQWEGMNHIEEQILYRVALLHPKTFNALDTFVAAHSNFGNDTIARFDREIQFYIAYLSYIEGFVRAGLHFCRPQLLRASKEVNVSAGFDLALAANLLTEKAAVVTNDFYLCGPERIFVVSGPNQGGKTTFGRMFGQLHYLAALGCPVPAREAHLGRFDRLFTHFEREENITNLRGKLQDDLVRIRQILDRATSESILVMNEMFSSTTFEDALYLSKQIMATITELDLLAVWVTFLDELATFNAKTVSIVSSVDPANLAIRTFKLERKPADGLAYALAIAEKHQVTYASLKERIKS